MLERTISVNCRDCGAAFEHTTRSNRPKLLCALCLLESQRKATREYTRRTRAAAKADRSQRTCLDCPADLTQAHGKILRCEPCRKANARDYQRKLRVERGSKAKSFDCIRCDNPIDRQGNSGRPIYCAPCGAEAKRESAARAEAKRTEARGARKATHCHYCDGELPKPYHPGRFKARCTACKLQRQYAYMRQRATERIASARCGDCGGPVTAQRRKGPRSRCAKCSKARELKRWRAYGSVYNNRRRALKRGSETEKFTKLEIFDRDGWRCGICRGKIRRALRHPHPRSISLDHKIPVTCGGAHTRVNVQAAHLRCNVAKSNRIKNEQLFLFG